MNYAERSNHCVNIVGKKLFKLMDIKKTNLALSADLIHCDKLLSLADKLGSEICVLKTHADILEGFSLDFAHELKKLAEKHQFLIFEDRKFADIGNTVKLQYQGGVYRIADWADIVNAHGLPGPGLIQGLAEVGLKKERGLLLLAQMSSESNLLDESYTRKTIKMAEQFPDFVMGFISQNKLSPNPQWIYMTPGVRFASSKDSLGQQYVTPEKAITVHGSDIIIVGRGIINSDDPLKAAKKYREAGWSAYLARL